DRIEKIAQGAQSMTVAEVDRLLYGATHPRDQLERALRIQALSPGWRGSFGALLDAAENSETEGNVGLVARQASQAAWDGFRPLNVVATPQESADVRSFVLASPDGAKLPAPVAGQHVAVKLMLHPAGRFVTRMYSLSGSTGLGTYRISVK